MQPQKCLLDRHRQFVAEVSRHLEQAPLRGKFQSVPGFHLDGGDAFRHQALGADGGRCMQLLVSRRARRLHRRLDAAAGARNLLVGNAAQPLFEFLHPIAPINQVRVAVDQPRGHPQTSCIFDRDVLRRRVGPGLGGGSNPGDTFALDRQAGVHEVAIGLATRDHGGNICADPHLVPLVARRFLHC